MEIYFYFGFVELRAEPSSSIQTSFWTYFWKCFCHTWAEVWQRKPNNYADSYVFKLCLLSNKMVINCMVD